MQDEDLTMEEDSKALRLFKRLAVFLPLLALPLAPQMGKGGAELLVYAFLYDGASQ